MKRLPLIPGVIIVVLLFAARGTLTAPQTSPTPPRSAVSSQSAPQTPPTPPRAVPARDNATPPPPVAGTAIVRGRVTAAANAQPLSRVRITMNGGTASAPTAVTDPNGNFEIKEVPAGTYSITAARAGYLTLQYGQRRPREAGRTLQVKNAEVVDHVDIGLFPGAVLGGRVLDQTAEPVARAVVEVMEMRTLRGRRMLLQAVGPSFTNDLGEFRISGLNPGVYYLKASTSETWPDDDPRKGGYAYAQTFYPNALGMDSAQSITLAIGREATGLDISMRVGRTVRISGTLVNSKGEPIPSQPVNMDRITRTVGGGLFSAGYGGAAIADKNGAFEFRDIPPGEYNLYSGDSQNEFASITPFMVTDGDITDVVLTPRRQSSLRGTVVSDDGSPLPFAATRLRVVPIPMDAASLLPPWGAPSAQTVVGDWSVRFRNIQGPHLFRATGMPDDWMLRAVRLGNRDITDVPFDVPSGGVETAGLELVLSKKTARVVGDVVSESGAPVPDSTVIVFSSDAQRWGPDSRFMKSARPGSQGHFAVAGLPTGSYLAIARDFVAQMP